VISGRQAAFCCNVVAAVATLFIRFAFAGAVNDDIRRLCKNKNAPETKSPARLLFFSSS
jgi:hypothetical protein